MEQVTNAIRQVREWFMNLTAREKQLILFVLISGIVLALYGIGGRIRERFADLEVRVEEANAELSSVSNLLAQYSKIRAQRDRIEREFKDVEFKEGELTYLEGLVRRKLELTGGFTLTPKGSSKFGSNYEQHVFGVKFTINDLKKLTDFLNEIVSGNPPMLLTRLDMRLTRNGEAIEVDMDVSSIKRAEVSSPARDKE